MSLVLPVTVALKDSQLLPTSPKRALIVPADNYASVFLLHLFAFEEKKSGLRVAFY